MVVSIPLASEGIAAFVRAARRRGPLLARPVMVAFVIVMAFLSLASLLKVTNEPFLNNRWTFYDGAEENSIRWAGDRLQANSLWIGPDTRLLSLIDYLEIKDVNSERSLSPEFSRYLISSDIMRMHAARSGYTFPDTRPLQKVYDAGSADLFYTRPQTPFQR
jgi:hypothetical protein